MSTTKQHFGKQVIGPASRPYMVRYILFRWGHLPRIYIHKFVRSDDERAPHNHPWWFMSLVLRGHYLEYTDTPPNPHVRKRFSLAYRGLNVFHRVALPNGHHYIGNGRYTYGPMPCWTLVITGPDVRSWGFRCPPDRVVPWREFDGCGE